MKALTVIVHFSLNSAVPYSERNKQSVPDLNNSTEHSKDIKRRGLITQNI